MNPIIIVAVDQKNGIGKSNTLPWKIPEDMRHFRIQTHNSCVIMGRNTYESIGKLLPGRENIVISREGGLGSRVPRVATLGQAFHRARIARFARTFVIGGEQIYRAALPYCNTVMLTRIPRDYRCDKFFPELDLSDGPDGWKRIAHRREYAESLEAHIEFIFYQRNEPINFEQLELPDSTPQLSLPARCENASVV